jgi:S-adenosylmethionine:tRNA ribosyltransferase-isomerase
VLTAEVIAAGERGERTLRLAPAGADEDFDSMLARIGHMPLPPYIRHGQDEAEDRDRYQTVYARDAGSAAAPTAGLHFTPEILDALRARGVEIAYVTLHVGLGTFQPVRVERVEEVRLHAERYTLRAETADALRRALREGRRVIAVGTTTTRTLEHIAREAGADPLFGPNPPKQSSEGASDSDWIEKIDAHSGKTSIFIAPGHRFRIVSGLLTNFHLPESTLLMLVSAFADDRKARGGTGEGVGVAMGAAAGEETSVDPNSNSDSGRRAVLAAYAHAVRERYRFYSYGDCMILL